MTLNAVPRVFYFWLPLWGPILSLLYLSRTHSKKINEHGGSKNVPRRSYSSSSRNLTSDLTALLNPLVSDEESYSYEHGTDQYSYRDDLFRETQGDTISSAGNSRLLRRDILNEGVRHGGGGGAEELNGDLVEIFHTDEYRSVSQDGHAVEEGRVLGLPTAGYSATPPIAKGGPGRRPRRPTHQNSDVELEERESEEGTSSTIDTLIEQHDGKVIFSPNFSMSYPFPEDRLRASSVNSLTTPETGAVHGPYDPSSIRTSESFVHFRTDLDSAMSPYLHIPHSESFDAAAFVSPDSALSSVEDRRKY